MIHLKNEIYFLLHEKHKETGKGLSDIKRNYKTYEQDHYSSTIS